MSERIESPSRLGLGLVFCALLAGSATAPACSNQSTPPGPDAAPSDAAAEAAEAAAEFDAAMADAAADAAADADADAVADAAAALPGTSEGCPGDMLLVAGEYCPLVQQKCLEFHEEYEKDQARKKKEGAGASTVSDRCLRYEEPSVCLSKKRTPMRFCMDRYEWPNQKGEVPALLVSWGDAQKLCEAKGKRLCTEAEFNFACEGEAMLPYTYGYVRDPAVCNIDKPYRKREKSLVKYERCMKRPACKAELERLDQRLPAGSMPRCVSPFGVYDLNGNINEWVVRPKQKYPNRSGLKGGWWGPVRNRCRPTVGFHKEDDYGYEEGFRCCKEAEGT
ncbi:formylglycine-generating enzyme family protein [Polyangium spumosum]|uniref:SUMF1/EgtB/PvdO family nonheme iron enzyme n=1 Tax=Polyangium spumosum TaxID=889282 RepID=A0A6N7Q3M3_9BACT|nr:SUMF1/EgtB/PvdO family nonheme iron enzyme [Polyangium spumosum]MRG97450.1 SUMF1/EgtB/PvdO family nonheme iron enzyme [Polyangium spumosum]